MKPILIIGEFSSKNATHLATNAGLEHAASALGVSNSFLWLRTDEVTETQLKQCSGLLVAPGSPYADMGNALAAIRFAREQLLPCIGTCGGFQHMLIEYARNILGISDAQHAESDPYASVLVISKLACSLVGRAMELSLVPGSRVSKIYGTTRATEQYYCNFGVNPEYVDRLKSGTLVVSGSDQEGEVRVIDLPQHPFFIGTLFVPQMRSHGGSPHPLIREFVRACTSSSR